VKNWIEQQPGNVVFLAEPFLPPMPQHDPLYKSAAGVQSSPSQDLFDRTKGI
jgi:hypothetical protein